MVFNATFSIISVISWQSVLLVEETEVSEENHDLLQVTDNFITFELTTLVVIDTDSADSFKFNYHMIMIMMAPYIYIYIQIMEWSDKGVTLEGMASYMGVAFGWRSL